MATMKAMKVIAYVGNFSQPFCTEVHIANTLERLGHQVIRLQEDKTDNPVVDCDLFLFTRTWGNTVTLDHLAQYEAKDIPTASYHLDLYVGLQREDGLDDDPFWRTKFVFTPDGDPNSAKVFKKKGINHYYMKPGVDKAECSISDVPKTKDLIFVGSKSYHAEWPYRPKLITWLRDVYGERFEHWGHDGLGTIRNEPLNQLYASTKVVVGDSLCLPGHTYYWSDRVYETLGRGGFLIHPYIKGLEEEFIDGQHLVFYEYGNFEELKAKIDWFLAHPFERETIRQAGHLQVKNNCTYDERLSKMMSICL